MPHFGNLMGKLRDENNLKANCRGGWSHPPPLKRVTTTSKYHDDETFMTVSLNLLARYEALNLSATESIKSTLICPDDQLAYYEALCLRLSQNQIVGGYSTCSMIQRLDQEFSSELKNLCSHRLSEVSFPGSIQTPPMTPRHDRGHHAGLNFFLNTRRNGETRSFFPDMEPRSHRHMMQSKVRNIDWQLASAVQQVVSLSLDGPPTERLDMATYSPPRAI